MYIFTKAIKAGSIIDTAEFLKSEQAIWLQLNTSRLVNIPISINKTYISFAVTLDVCGWCHIFYCMVALSIILFACQSFRCLMSRVVEELVADSKTNFI